MLFFRWGMIAAVAAFIISIGLGIISGVSAFYIIIRAVIFAVLFFGIGFALKFLGGTFFPELTLEGDESGKQSSFEQGAVHESVMIDTIGEYAVPELYKSPGDPDELGNIDDLIAGIFTPHLEAVDGNGEGGYNRGNVQSKAGASLRSSRTREQDNISFEDMFHDTEVPGETELESADEERPAAARPHFTPSFGDDSGDLGGLPDLDTMAMAFGAAEPLSSATGSSYSGIDDAVPAERRDIGLQSSYMGNKPQPLKGDFNPKELAEGLRTVLNREK